MPINCRTILHALTALKNSNFWVTISRSPLKFNGLDGDISPKIEIFITTALRTSKLTILTRCGDIHLHARAVG
jgi:hypothetical protein